MQSGRIRFDRFELDLAERRLLRDGAPVELSSRYLDALALLLGDAGKLVSKERFLNEVWHGVPVTDEALTQCIKTLRRQLEDDASNPKFIETVPKHGYRFIAPVGTATAAVADVRSAWPGDSALALAGAIGGGMAGLVGGLIYGFAAAAEPHPGPGAISIVLVLMCLCILVALTGGAGVSLGIVAARRLASRTWYWPVAGGAVGGLLIGGLVKLLGVDAFNLLLGRSPGDITGGPEGAMLGGAVGLGAWLALRDPQPSLRRGSAAAALAGAVAGLLVIATGGQLMAGSLALLGESFPGSRLRVDQLGALLGETGFGPLSRLFTGALEGGLFSACVVGAMILAKKSLPAED